MGNPCRTRSASPAHRRQRCVDRWRRGPSGNRCIHNLPYLHKESAPARSRTWIYHLGGHLRGRQKDGPYSCLLAIRPVIPHADMARSDWVWAAELGCCPKARPSPSASTRSAHPPRHGVRGRSFAVPRAHFGGDTDTLDWRADPHLLAILARGVKREREAREKGQFAWHRDELDQPARRARARPRQPALTAAGEA
jgi:hypothetical protein